MTKKQAVELILTGRRAAARVGKDFVVDREKLGCFGGFSTDEMDQIDAAVIDIETNYARAMETVT